jgi:hypothetical protein
MDDPVNDLHADVVIRPAIIGWKARARPLRHDTTIDDRAHWRLTRRWAIRAVERRLRKRPPGPVLPDDDWEED